MESLVFILMQELFENDLYDIDFLSSKYAMNDYQIELLNNIYNELYGDDDDIEKPWDYGKHFD